MRLPYTLIIVAVVIHSTWTRGSKSEYVPCTTGQRDLQILRNHCLRAAGCAWGKQAAYCCPGNQGPVGRSVLLEIRLWQEWCTTCKRAPLVGICFLYEICQFALTVYFSRVVVRKERLAREPRPCCNIKKSFHVHRRIRVQPGKKVESWNFQESYLDGHLTPWWKVPPKIPAEEIFLFKMTVIFHNRQFTNGPWGMYHRFSLSTLSLS